MNKALVKFTRIDNQTLKQLLLISITLAVVTALSLVPEISLANSLEAQLDKVGGLATGKVKTIGISGATILAAIWSIVRGNIKLAGVIVAIGVILGFYLEWINAGMKITG